MASKRLRSTRWKSDRRDLGSHVHQALDVVLLEVVQCDAANASEVHLLVELGKVTKRWVQQ